MDRHMVRVQRIIYKQLTYLVTRLESLDRSKT